MSYFLHLPMLRNLPNPFHARIFHFLFGGHYPFSIFHYQLPRYGLMNQDLFAFFKQTYLLLLDANGLIYFGGFVVQKLSDGGLFEERGDCNLEIFNISWRDMRNHWIGFR